MKFVVAELSSQTLRGLRELCEALNSDESEVRGCEAFVSNAPRLLPSRYGTINSNKKFHSVQSETLRVCVINAKFSVLNFTSVKFVVATLSTQTLRGLREFCEALNSDECKVCGCEAFVSDAPRPTQNLRSPQL